MDIRKLQRAIVDGLEDVKAQDIVVFNTEHLSPLFERVIIASGTSNRQTKALASGVRDAVRAAGFPVLATEGGENGEWIIVDCGAAVAHVMQPAIRDYYRLEEIWGGKAVRMKIGSAAPRGLVKASEDEGEDEDDAPMAPQRRAAAKKGSAGRARPDATAARPARAAKTAPGPRAAAREAAAKTGARKTAGAAQAAAAKPAGARPSAARKLAAAKSPARKVAAKTTAAKTTAAKAPARKTSATAAKVQTIVVKPIQRRSPAAKTGPGRPAPARKSAGAAKKAAPRR